MSMDTSTRHTPAVRRLALAAVFIAALFTGTGRADTAEPPTPVDFEPLKQRLIEDGVSPSTVYAYFDDPRFELQHNLLRVNIRQPSGTAGYERFVGDASVRTATAFLELHRNEIEEVLEGTPVNPEVVVAILNVESSLGTYKGTYRLMNVFASLTLLESDSIATIAPGFWDRVLDGFPLEEHPAAREKALRRSRSKARWAYRELRALLEMAEAGHLDPLQTKGSWAGAYGLPQFIPTSARAYGRDGNGDGIVDLNTLPDAVASIAHYLRVHGYREDSPAKKRKAVWHYNHSDEYVDCILTLSDRIREHARNGNATP